VHPLLLIYGLNATHDVKQEDETAELMLYKNVTCVVYSRTPLSKHLLYVLVSAKIGLHFIV